MATIKEREYECECEECDGIITYTKSDIVKEYEYDDEVEGNFYVEYILCPKCHRKIYFKTIPSYIYEQELEEKCIDEMTRNYSEFEDDYYNGDEYWDDDN